MLKLARPSNGLAVEVMLDTRLVEFIETLAERVCEGKTRDFIDLQCLALQTLQGNAHFMRGLIAEDVTILERKRFEAACVLFLTERTTEIWARTRLQPKM